MLFLSKNQLMNKALSLLLIFLSGILFSQVNISDLNSLGIKSEQDLKNLGMSSAEISSLKQQYFNGKTNSKSKDLSEDAKLKQTPPKPEVISIPKKKIEKIDSTTYTYGQSIFVDGSVKIQKNSDRIKAPGDYILGSGDVISIVIWGTSEFSGTFTLDEYGNITPSLVGRISLKGKKLSNAKKIIKSAFGRVYDLRNSKISTEISYSKVISVNIGGEVISPGTYSIPAINSAFNFLSLAGGVKKLGSVRNIKIVHSNGKVDVLDIYKFLTNPVDYQQKYLKDGDFIIVPTSNNIVSIKGVKKSSQYELIKNETLKDLIYYSGGVLDSYYAETAHIERLSNSGIEIIDVTQKDFASFKLKSGDKISFYEMDESYLNLISIKGAVITPGKYAHVENETLKSLITRSGGVIPNAEVNIGHIYRLNNDGTRNLIRINLKKVLNNENNDNGNLIFPNDIINIFDSRIIKVNHSVKITGMVRKPNNYAFAKNMNIQDLLVLSGGLKENADQTKIDIERVDFTEGENGYIKITELNLATANNFELKPYDIVHIRKLPQFSYQQMVSVKGEVKYPGNYSIAGKSEKLFDLVQRAGGITENAFLQGGYITRQEDSVGLVVIKLENLMKSEKSKYNYIIKPGDIIHIPKESNIVSIQGEIGFSSHNVNGDNKISCPFSKGKRAGRYINQYGGGFSKKAKKYNVYVIRHNGLVEDSKFFGLIRPIVRKGDIIKVDAKTPKKQKTKESKVDWNRTIESLSIKITGLATFWVLTQQINP